MRRLRLQSHHRERIRVICRCNSADSPGLILPPIPVSSSISALSTYTRCLIPAATSSAVRPTERRRGELDVEIAERERESVKRVDPRQTRNERFHSLVSPSVIFRRFYSESKCGFLWMFHRSGLYLAMSHS